MRKMKKLLMDNFGFADIHIEDYESGIPMSAYVQR